MLLQYFDAYFYLANWGTRRLMFRFPKGVLNQDEIEPYCDEEQTTFETFGEYQVLTIDFNPEGGGGWVEEQNGTLSLFIQLREDLLQGDYRLLYLAWLKSRTLMKTSLTMRKATRMTLVRLFLLDSTSSPLPCKTLCRCSSWILTW